MLDVRHTLLGAATLLGCWSTGAFAADYDKDKTPNIEYDKDFDDLMAEVAKLGAGIVKDYKLDPWLSKVIQFEPGLIAVHQQSYASIDLKDYSDPSSAVVGEATGALILRDPAETGEFVRYRYRDETGNWLRHPDGRYVVTNWYRTSDGRLTKILQNEDGDAVGTYTIDPINGGYEINVDLDSDRVVDVMDSVTGDGHEQIMATIEGLEWIDDFLSGQNAMCFSVAEGGTPGIPGFGASADPRATASGCRMERGSQTGGFPGSLGNPSSGWNPIADLCARFAADPGEGSALRDAISGAVRADCTETCEQRRSACFGGCTSPNPSVNAGCIQVCNDNAEQCNADCAAEVDAAGTTEDVPDAPVATPSTPPAESRYHDTDGDGRADSEDTNGDGAPDASCANAGCGTEAYPPPNDDLGGEDWGAFCHQSESGTSQLEDMMADAMDCPALDESTSYDSVDAWFADCFGVPERQDIEDMLRDAGSTSCGDNPRGCEPDIRSTLRARMGVHNDATMSMFVDCGPDLLCQPLP